MIIKEYRVTLPLTVEEYQVAQLWSVAEASKNETGGGEGVEVVHNEPYDIPNKVHPPVDPLLDNDPRWNRGQYTLKWYRFASRVPKIISKLAPEGSLEMREEAWNGFPYCRTIVTNPYMKENFFIKIETIHLADAGTTENAHHLPPDVLKKREVVHIDIAHDHVKSSDYKPESDPIKFKSQKTGRGPLTSPNWMSEVKPVMTCYKLVTAKFKWRFLPFSVEKMIHTFERRIFTNFHRQVFCWMDKWYGLTMADIRALERETQAHLAENINKGGKKGTGLNEEEDKVDAASTGSSQQQEQEQEDGNEKGSKEKNHKDKKDKKDKHKEEKKEKNAKHQHKAEAAENDEFEDARS